MQKSTSTAINTATSLWLLINEPHDLACFHTAIFYPPNMNTMLENSHFVLYLH